jgi:hypothetical protein
LKWQDVEWDNKIIRIDKAYWNGKKRAPPMTPLTERLTFALRQYYDALPVGAKKPDDKIFLSKGKRKRDKRTIAKLNESPEVIIDKYECRITRTSKFNPKRHLRRKLVQFPDRDPYVVETKWCDKGFERIIRRTDLWKPKVRNGQVVLDDNGNPEKDWFHFHDLRHTATTRYAEPPYSLDAQEYEYLKGNRIAYNHPQHIRITSRIRANIERGDRETVYPNGNGPLWTPDCFALVRALFISNPSGRSDEQHGKYIKNLEAMPFPTPEQYREWRAKLANDNLAGE